MVIYVKYITYEGLLHNTLALDVDTVQGKKRVNSTMRKDYTPLHVYQGCDWVVIDVKYITYEGLLHNTLALDVDTVQEACIQQTRVSWVYLQRFRRYLEDKTTTSILVV